MNRKTFQTIRLGAALPTAGAASAIQPGNQPLRLVRVAGAEPRHDPRDVAAEAAHDHLP